MNCGECWRSIADGKVFCSMECYNKNRKLKEGHCIVCDSSFIATKRSGRPPKRTCSPKCRQKLGASNRYGRQVTNDTRTKEEILAALEECKLVTVAAKKKLNIGTWSLQQQMKKYGIEWTDEDRARTIDMSEEAKDFIDGLLLSDGGIGCVSSVAARLEVNTPHKEYAELIRDEFVKYGLEASISSYMRFDKFVGYERPSHIVYTMNYTNFLKEKQRWYPNGVKIVPRDLRNTPMMWKWEYVGDGNVESCSEYSLQIVLATNCFPYQDVACLSKMLQLDGIGCKVISRAQRGHEERLIVIYGDSWKFLDFIGECPSEFFRYKWPTKPKMRNCVDCLESYVPERATSIRCHDCVTIHRERKYANGIPCACGTGAPITTNGVCLRCYAWCRLNKVPFTAVPVHNKKVRTE